MKILRPTLIVALAALAPVYGQAEEPANQRPARRGQTSTISLEFPGGSLVQFVAAVQRVHPKCNILMREGGDRVKVPEVAVRDATVEAVLEAVAEISSTAEVAVDVRTYQSRGAEPIFALQVKFRQSRGMTSKPTKQVLEVTSLARLILLGHKVETLLTAVDTGLEISASGSEGAEIRYHRESSLLFVRGSMEQVSTVRQVIGALMNAAPRGKSAKTEPAPANAAEPAAPAQPEPMKPAKTDRRR